jgi:hypothetical protein
LLVVKEQFQHRIRDCLLIPELCCPLSLLGLAFDFQFWQLPDFGNFGTFPASFVVQGFPLRSLRP